MQTESATCSTSRLPRKLAASWSSPTLIARPLSRRWNRVMSDLQVHSGAYTLSCNNVKIEKAIESIRVIQEICVPTMFEVTIPIESIEDPWWAVTLNELKPGDEVKVGLGRGRAKPLVTGYITMIWP